MRATKFLLVAFAAASALVAPANANTEWAGFTCGFASTNDPTGVVNQDPNVQTGELDCGPWTAMDITNDDLSGPAGSPSAAHIEICGWIQVNISAYVGPASASAQVCSEGDGAAYGAGIITYTAAATDNVFLCTEVTMTDDVVEVYQYDDDDNAANGNQCALAISAGA